MSTVPGFDGKERVRPIGQIIKRLLRRKRFYEKGKYGPLVDAWSELVGEGIARRTRISSFKGGELVIDVHSSVLLHELNSFLKDELLAGLRDAEAGRDVVELRFRLGRVADEPAAGTT